MLDEPDTKIVMRWLSTALAAANKRGLTAADLARHCSVTPQAVNGWLKTGRMSKSKVEAAAKFFGVAPNFSGSSAVVARDSNAGGYWPFEAVDVYKVNALPRDQLLRLEGSLLATANLLGLHVAKRRAA